ncbi:MAG: transporter substrate-binding domain-containing protein [Clostridia bacterium]|nr:transporter substrate-binding domain-containing protein [Clostridia bacterium]
MKKILSIALAVLLLAVSLCAVSCDKPTDSGLAYGKECLAVASQLDALNGLVKGDADIAVIDSVMAGYYMKSVDTFKDYQVLENVVLAEEKYGIAAKKGNDALMGKVNEALIALADTDYKTVADTYGLTTELLVKADTVNPYASAADASWDNVAAAKKVVIGYTLFAPIAYNEGDGAAATLKGFDIDLAKAVFAYLNNKYSTEVAVEFIIIEWNQKEAMLENGSIDLVWNGMTITPEREAEMCISVPYLANKQVAVIKKADAEKYAAADAAAFAKKATDAVIIVEKGSAGEALVAPVE